MNIYIIPPESQGGFNGKQLMIAFRDLPGLATMVLRDAKAHPDNPDKHDPANAREAQINCAKLIALYHRIVRHNGRMTAEERVELNALTLAFWLADHERVNAEKIAAAIRTHKQGIVQLPERPDQSPRCGWTEPLPDADRPPIKIDERAALKEEHRNMGKKQGGE
jgi:hypothetical protein